jgi:hypothetical protein
MGIEVHLQERFQIGSILKIEVPVPPRDEPIKAMGILRWIKQKQLDFIGGIELAEILDNSTFAKLS